MHVYVFLYENTFIHLGLPYRNPLTMIVFEPLTMIVFLKIIHFRVSGGINILKWMTDSCSWPGIKNPFTL